MNIKTTLISLLLSLALAVHGNVMANPDDLEREELARISSELLLVKKMVEATEIKVGDTQNPYKTFRYDILKSEIQIIIDGIKEQLGRPLRQPKVIEPLAGEYGN